MKKAIILFALAISATVLFAQKTNTNKVANDLQKQLTETFKNENLTPDNAVLLLIDHQVGLISGVRDMEPGEYKNRVLALAEVGKVFNLPVLLSTSRDVGPNGFLIPELEALYDNTKIIRRPGVINAYAYEPFRKALEATGRKKVIIAAITLETCVLFPTLDMLEDGYDVYPVVDASGSWSTYDAQAAMLRMSQAGAKMTSVFSVLCELQADWRRPTAQAAAAVFHKYLPQYAYTIDAYVNYTSNRNQNVPAEWGEAKNNN